MFGLRRWLFGNLVNLQALAGMHIQRNFLAFTQPLLAHHSTSLLTYRFHQYILVVRAWAFYNHFSRHFISPSWFNKLNIVPDSYDFLHKNHGHSPCNAGYAKRHDAGPDHQQAECIDRLPRARRAVVVGAATEGAAHTKTAC